MMHTKQLLSAETQASLQATLVVKREIQLEASGSSDDLSHRHNEDIATEGYNNYKLHDRSTHHVGHQITTHLTGVWCHD